ncbi:MAG: lipid-A-disaccharide synthase [Bdellovibrionales bacterium]
MQEETKAQILIVSAEPSSNLYAERLMESFSERKIKVDFFGIGNQKMVDLGLDAQGRAEDMAVMGLVEVLKHYKDIKKVYNQILIEAKNRKPAVAVLMDYAEFNLKLAGDLHKIGVKVVFYISPQIWAWRSSRVKKINKTVDRMLCIFPFEESFYKKHSMKTEFVGHPLLAEISADLVDPKVIDLQKKRRGIGGKKVLGIMPGSRRSEIELNLATQLEAAKLVKQKYSDVVLMLLVAPGLDLDEVRAKVPEDYPEYMIVQDEPKKMISLIDFALTASGTATLMTGLLQKPMVVMYKMKSLTAFIARRLISDSNPFFAMINLIFEKELMPERFQEAANPKALAQLIEENFLDTEKYMSLKSELELLPDKLGQGNATDSVVKILKEYLN